MRTTDTGMTAMSPSRKKLVAAATCAAAAVSVSAGVALTGHGANAAGIAGVTHHSVARKHNPVGYLDRIQISNHTVTLTGWTYDPDAVTHPIQVLVRSDGARVATARTSYVRTDVNRYYHRAITTPGYVASFRAAYGTHRVCLYGLNTGLGASARLTCQKITVRDLHKPRGTAKFTVNRAARSMTVRGAAYDPDARQSAIQVAVSATAHKTALVTANDSSFAFDHRFKISGAHGYTKTVKFGYGKATVCAKAINVKAGSSSPTLGCKTVTFARPASARPSSTIGGSSKNSQIAAMAKTFVGRVPFVTAGTSPRTGFDCSGLTRYVYGKQGIALAHSADQQYSHFRKLARSSARPGDLVFFLSGGRAYHVAVYEGNNMIVAAATYGEGVKYQPIWTTNVRFGTVLH